MTRKDSAQDLDRPHYYSQFWIDVASGKRDIAASHVAEADPVEFDDLEDEAIEHEIDLPVAPPKAPAKPKASKAQDKKPEPVRPTITSLADLANIDLLMKNSAAMDGVDVPDIEAGAMDDLAPFSPEPAAAAPIVTDFDVEKVKAEPVAAETDEFEDEFEDEEEEDEWGAPRKPGKQQKQPPRRRDRPTRF